MARKKKDSMTPTTSEILIAQAQTAYDNGEPIMSDEQFDALTEDAPLNISEAGKVHHAIPMLSQGKCHEHEDVVKFLLDTQDAKYSVSLKLDGFACNLEYVYGKFVNASTRGNGSYGEDITDAVLAYVGNLRRELPERVNCSIRGEIVLGDGRNVDNARNIAVGMCKRKGDSIGPSNKTLEFYAYDIVGITFDYEWDKLKYLESLGVATVPATVVPGNSALQAVQQLESARETYPYASDGIVVKCNSRRLQVKLGTTAHHPKYSIAYKFKVPEVITTVEKIEITVGKKSGKRTPVAYLTPVMCDGAVVKKVSLGSEAVMESMGVKEGCKVRLSRSGGVIPHIEGVVE